MQRLIPKSAFARQVMTLMGGTGLAQVLPIIVAPILTRLYSPADFGVLALFVSLTAILSIFASARYEMAILLPATDDDAAHVAMLGMTLGIASSGLLLLVSLAFAGPVAERLGSPAIERWLPWAALTVWSMSTYQSLNYWFNRRQQYRRLALNRVNRAAITVGGMLVLGLAGVKGGLVLGTIIGQFAATGAFLWQAFREERGRLQAVTRERMQAMARRYSAFPRYSVPADSINAASAQMPVFILTTVFGPLYAGYFGLTQRVLGAPISMVSTAFGEVYQQRASRDFAEIGNCRAAWMATFKRLALFSFLPAVVLAAGAPPIFAFAFGEEWREAGRMAQRMSPFFFLAFTVSPLARTLYVAEKQKQDLAWQIGLAVFTIGGLLLGARMGDPLLAVTLFAAAYCAMYSIYLLMSFKYSMPNGASRPGPTPTTATA